MLGQVGAQALPLEVELSLFLARRTPEQARHGSQVVGIAGAPPAGHSVAQRHDFGDAQVEAAAMQAHKEFQRQRVGIERSRRWIGAGRDRLGLARFETEQAADGGEEGRARRTHAGRGQRMRSLKSSSGKGSCSAGSAGSVSVAR